MRLSYMGMLAVLGLLVLVGCQPPAQESAGERSRTSSTARPGVGGLVLPSEPVVSRLPRTGDVQAEPTMRVRVKVQAERAEFDSVRTITIAPLMSTGEPDPAAARRFTSPVTVAHDGQRFRFQDGSGRSLAWRAGAFHLSTGYGTDIRLGEHRYPGTFALVALAGSDGQPTGMFDVVNHVPMEAYLPGVLERELFPNWQLEAFVAQAIAARSYALFERRVNADRHYDIQATTASQVYGGTGTNPRAIDATRMTRGMVLTHQGAVVPGFYSSACGGLTQTATSAFPHFQQAVGITPLRGGVTCDHCRPSPNHRWGPVHRNADELADRIAAWGRANRNAVASLDGLRSVRLSHRSIAGRPARFEVTDRIGRTYPLAAEHFRFACNFAHPDRGPVPREQQLLSSHVEVRMQGSQITFTDGRGFGHGAGMCQWGAQGMASRGYTGRDIVRHYYPDAELRRMY
ncbi:SpoIID/LytB domain-containing protein [Phycisphaerales bacterium AB-hyl4]|uniref:SpoIID/LytB domain-containing protein n=1 Tax=Natronomicrosphaera hydrolytica TaxID=3242702 RepID=A0ABV4U0C6_9BACT